MKAALTPDLALQYLAELDPAISSVAVLAGDGAVLAGDRALAERVVADGGGAGVVAGAGGAGVAADAGGTADRVLVARSARHIVAAVVRPGAVTGLVEHDLEAVARELDGG